MMKKLYFAIALFVGLNVSMAQTISTGVVNLNSLMTLKIDKNFNSTVTITLTGPSNKWFGIGFNATSMGNGTDCLYYASSFVDATINGQGPPTTDTDNSNNWVISETTSGAIRTLVLTRGFAGGAGDYTFAYNNNPMNIIWAYGSGLAMNQHAGGPARGFSTLEFTLGVEDFTSLEKINIAPNPSNGIVTLTKNNQTTISKVTVFDSNGKVVKVVDSELSLDAIQINLSDFSKGVYFLEISNEIDKVVRKIVIE
jgi:hypothetical protein